MSYLALARKWRPRRFEDVMGQSHVVQALSHALDGDRLHPAILLTGTRGVGKTTLARIIAKGLNCETGVSAHPCGVCSACKEVDEGRSVDMLEIDAASNTGVDNVRDLIDNAQYSPAGGRYKVYLIDEVHMLSKGAFNALLKTLEEPPPHVKFILATTDPQKLPMTVLSRCLQFNLRRLTVGLIREQLAQVLNSEGIAFEPAALVELARAADGSMRDGLSLLDQAIAFAGGGAVQQRAVEDMLGSVGRQTLFDLLGAIAGHDADAMLACIQRLDAQAPDYNALLNELAEVLQRIAVLQLLPNARNDEDEDAVVALKERLSPEDVQLCYQIAILGRRDMVWAPGPRLGFEMTLLRMMAFRLDEGMPQAAPQAPAPRAATKGGAASATPAAQQAATGRALPADADWPMRVEAMTLDVFATQLARHCAWLGREDHRVRLSLDRKARHLLQDDRRDAIAQALSAQLGAAISLEIEVAAEQPAAATPAQLDQQRAEQRQHAAEQAVESDSGVRAFKDMFGASVQPDSIRPLE
ncbi:MAG TPA: DNA polymerase III subunit gamma/tau [Stenotrophobium sp.]|jgi:DNA polymerase-3 subunit gamma/tau|nr:DNA polymerase III subunit gamma/tau [Stenotrophobium sp.]